MKQHVQHRAQGAQLPAKAERRHHDPRVVDARIGQDAAEIALRQNERRGHEDGRHAEARQQFARKLVAQAFLGQHVEADDAIKGAIDEARPSSAAVGTGASE